MCSKYLSRSAAGARARFMSIGNAAMWLRINKSLNYEHMPGI